MGLPVSALSLRFLGVGGSSGLELGSAAAVLEAGGQPALLIDCGQEVPQRFRRSYQSLPPAVFLTHVHMDHVSGLEPLFYDAWFDGGRQRPIPVFVPAAIVPALQERLVIERSPLAEGGFNFWDAFQLIPVGRGLWSGGLWFDVFPVRHHRPGFAYGIRLAGKFLYTGDTRPIPEVMVEFASAGETVFHDARIDGNPSHAGWDELVREYPPELISRLIAYHFGTPQDGIRLRNLGARVAEADIFYRLGESSGEPDSAGAPPADGSRVA